MKKIKPLALDRALPYILIVCGIIGTLCAYIILYDKLKVLANPHYHPSCSLNPVISCGSVMQSAQSHILGAPNPSLGLIAFPVVLTIGVAMLAGATFKRWFWLGLQVGSLFGLGFIHWLFFESVYRIHAVCPFCIVTWLVTFATFWYVLLYNLRSGYIKAPPKLRSTVGFMQRHHADIFIAWAIIIAILILHQFWYYFGKHL